MPAAAVLEVWSELINDDIQSRQKFNDVKALSDHPSQNAALCNLLVSLSDDVREQKEKTNHLVSELAATKATFMQVMEKNLFLGGEIERLESEKASLQQQLDEMDEQYRALYEFSRSTNMKTPEKKRKVAARTTSTVPQPRNKICRPSSGFDLTKHDDSIEIPPTSMAENVSTTASHEVETVETDFASSPSLHMLSATSSFAYSTSTTTAEAPSSENNNPTSLQWNHQAEITATASSSGDANKRFLDMLLELARRGLIKPGTKLQNIDVSDFVINPSKLKYCLEVADFVCDSADVGTLSTYKDVAVRNDNDRKVVVMNAGVRIEDAVFKKLEEFEENKSRKKSCGRSFLSIAKRVLAYKHEIKEATNDVRKVGSVPLMEREQLNEIIRAVQSWQLHRISN